MTPYMSQTVWRWYIGPGSLSRPHGGCRFLSKGQDPSRVDHPRSVWSRLQLQVVFFSHGMVPMWPEMSLHTRTNCFWVIFLFQVNVATVGDGQMAKNSKNWWMWPLLQHLVSVLIGL